MSYCMILVLICFISILVPIVAAPGHFVSGGNSYLVNLKNETSFVAFFWTNIMLLSTTLRYVWVIFGAGGSKPLFSLSTLYSYAGSMRKIGSDSSGLGITFFNSLYTHTLVTCNYYFRGRQPFSLLIAEKRKYVRFWVRDKKNSYWLPLKLLLHFWSIFRKT